MTAPTTTAAATDFERFADRYLAMWNATDPAVRHKLVAELCSGDVRYTDPLADAEGPSALEATIAAVQGQFPGFTFTLAGPVDGHHAQARFGWELGPQGSAAPIAGFDVITLDADAKISRVLGFLDRVPG